EITATRAPASTSRVRVGSAARMRPSSVIVVLSSGTLRSARTSTRLPRSSPSESMVFSTVVLLQGFDRGTPERPVGTGDERSPPDADPSGWRPAGSGAVLVVSGTTRGSEGLADQLRELDEAVGEAPLVVVPGEDLDLVAVHLG